MARRRPARLVARLAALAIPGAPAADHCPARSGGQSVKNHPSGPPRGPAMLIRVHSMYITK